MPDWKTHHRVRIAAAILRRGGVIACPTESVWGLSCDPFNEAAVQRILALKNRPQEKGLILAAGDRNHFGGLLTNLDAPLRERAISRWPGPVTWLVPHFGLVPEWVTGEHSTVAIRHTAEPMLAAISEVFGGPLVSTSANPAGKQPATRAFQVQRYFGGELDYICPGNTGGLSKPSEILDLRSGSVVRAG